MGMGGGGAESALIENSRTTLLKTHIWRNPGYVEEYSEEGLLITVNCVFSRRIKKLNTVFSNPLKLLNSCLVTGLWCCQLALYKISELSGVTFCWNKI